MLAKNSILGWLLFNITLCASCQYQPPQIIPLMLFTHTDTSFANNDTTIVQGYTFIVKNYRDDTETEKLIDSFVFSRRDTNFTMNTSIVITFYKESSITNPEHLAKNKRDIDRYSYKEDMIYTYRQTHYKKKYSGWHKQKIKNGKSLSPDNIIVEDTKPPVP